MYVDLVDEKPAKELEEEGGIGSAVVLESLSYDNEGRTDPTRKHSDTILPSYQPLAVENKVNDSVLSILNRNQKIFTSDCINKNSTMEVKKSDVEASKEVVLENVRTKRSSASDIIIDIKDNEEKEPMIKSDKKVEIVESKKR